ncbi:MAG: cyclic nucleotide-binding domain-containing protein [Methylovulum sp.]|jgi:CRP-like cAMP-binding protein|nr:cyclic nucleotide-binding domain-containing protein [Methylovulum sp.]
MERIGKYTETMHFAAGQTISVEGSIGMGWYILLQGTIGVYKKGARIAEFTKKGAVFGELSTILNTPRTATLKADSVADVLYIEENLEQLIIKHPDITRKIIVSLAERLTKTTRDLTKTF